MTQPPGGDVDPGWLVLRGPADSRARTAFASALAGDLARHLARRGPGPGERDHGDDCDDSDAVVRLVDVGAGTGGGARWLRTRLPLAQDWRLVDHDPDILAAGTDRHQGWARAVVAGVDDLPRLLAEEPAHVVTCQALLDVLTAPQVDALVEAAVSSRAALLLGLSVTGRVQVSPAHPDDGLVGAAFDAHQRRAGRLGPDGGAYAAELLRRDGYRVTVAATPWHLGPAESALAREWVQGRAAAAMEQQPGHGERIARWRRSRMETAGSGRLEAVVGHTDVLGLPPPAAGAA